MLWHVTFNNYFYHWEMIWKYIFRNSFWSLWFFSLPKTWIIHTGQTYINTKNKYLQEQTVLHYESRLSVFFFTNGCWGHDVWIFVDAAGNSHLDCFSLPEFFQESAGNGMSETQLQCLYLSPILILKHMNTYWLLFGSLVLFMTFIISYCYLCVFSFSQLWLGNALVSN